ncbi:MAG: methylamine utilization protein [Algicola sp.]|nr:methylamine utilization protein [Algicola sp.]
MHIFQNKIKKAHYAIVCLLLVISSCKNQETTVAKAPLDQLEASYTARLDSCIVFLDVLKQLNTQEQYIANYLQARKQFKFVEPVLAFTDKENYKTLNGPNILRVDEEDATDIKIKKPFGFQAIEELIFDDSLDVTTLKHVALKTQNRLKLIKANTALRLKEYHVLWLIRDQIARIALTGITGFDSPVLEQSLEEAALTYQAIENIFKMYQPQFQSNILYNEVLGEIEVSKHTLRNGDFKSFNRYDFIKEQTHKQLALLNKVKADWQVEFPLELAFNNNMTSLFSVDTFNMDFFSDYIETDSLIAPKAALGKQLFNDVRLSSNNDMSCATCHNSDKAFTDGLKLFPKQMRNTPTLTYAAYQQSYFYDGRTGNLEGQIVDVIHNDNEFHTNLSDFETVVTKDSLYVNTFKKLYKKGVTQDNVRNAIAVYVRSLGDFSSKFDKNINGLENTLTEREINGFNLFMGKAKCATCHFAPVFNGTVPPNFSESEFELLGVPKDTISNTLDTDLGRYDLFKTEERKFFFKTPTVRNIAKTGPYMHNGVYTTLNQVMTFYNEGGGAGLGMDLEYQTLPEDHLNLTESEVEDLILFMEALTDTPPAKVMVP